MEKLATDTVLKQAALMAEEIATDTVCLMATFNKNGLIRTSVNFTISQISHFSHVSRRKSKISTTMVQPPTGTLVGHLRIKNDSNEQK